MRDIEVAYRMFDRWRQESFFRYLREEFPLDALVDYRIELEDPARTIPIPNDALEAQCRAARVERAKVERECGAAADNTEQRRPTMRGFKITHGTLGQQLRAARKHLRKRIREWCRIPARVQIRDVNERTDVKFATERKHLIDIIKMLAYRIESDLYNLLRSHYLRAKPEYRTLLHELFAAAGQAHQSTAAPRTPSRSPDHPETGHFPKGAISGGLQSYHT